MKIQTSNNANIEFVGHDEPNPDRATLLMIPCNDYYFLDASSGNATAPANEVVGGGDIQNNWQNCRFIRADTAGVVKIDYTNKLDATVTEVLYLPAGIPMPIRNVTKLYRYTSGTTAGTAKSYSASGVETTNAIKLMR